MKDTDVEKYLANMAKTKKMAAEAVKENTIGKYTLKMISRNGEVSVEALTAALEDAIANSSSAHGKGAPEQDMARLAAEAALNHIRSLLTPGG